MDAVWNPILGVASFLPSPGTYPFYLLITLLGGEEEVSAFQDHVGWVATIKQTTLNHRYGTVSNLVDKVETFEF